MPNCSPNLFFHNICFCREALQSWRFSNHLSFWFHAPLLGLSRNQNKQEGAGRTNTLMLLKRGQKTNKTHSNRMWTIINPHTITQTVSNSSKASLNSAFWSSIIEAMMIGLVLIGNYWQLLMVPRPPFLRDRTLDRRCRREWSGFRPSSCHSSIGDCVFSTNEKGAQVHLRQRVFFTTNICCCRFNGILIPCQILVGDKKGLHTNLNSSFEQL